MGNLLRRIVKRSQVTFFPTIHDRELRRWYRDCGECTRRYTYGLSSDSIVIDLGGYDGQWASNIYSRYLSEIHVFEPVRDFADRISHRFKHNPCIRVYPFALGKNNREDEMSVAGVGSSLHRKGRRQIEVCVKDATELFRLCGVTHCDLLKVNIEGGEYEVLPRLLETELVSDIDNLQIQFHNLTPESLPKMRLIQDALSKTHEQTWQYMWVWENWKRIGR